MEFVESFLDQEWESLSKMFSIGENNPDLLLFPSNYCENMANEGSSLFFPSSCEIDHTFHNNVYRVPQESSNSNNNGVSFHHQEEEYLTNNTFDECMNYYTSMMVPVFSDDVVMEEMFDNQSGGHNNAETDDSCKDIIRLKRKYEAEEDQEPIIEVPSKRKPRVSRNKNQKAANQSKKKKKMIGDDEEEINNEENNMIINNDGGGNNQISSSSCSSEDIHADSITTNASESKLDSVSLKSLNGKAKANRGSATDPQSLYARKRRERINERLKILQNLVPNGTKVDISTMLEEAVQYVKFLQLQIKLLSSDDLWMYAPIAYNGMDIGMYQKISPNFCL